MFFVKKKPVSVAQFKKMSYTCTGFQSTNLNRLNKDMSTEKRRAVVSYENMSEELAAAFAEKYPKGYADYFHDLVKYDKPNGDCFYAVTVEIPDAIYLVKIKVKTDDAEDIERWLDGDDGDDSDSDNDGLPDDNISQYSGEDDAADSE